MPNVWTIHANGLTGGSDKSDLVGCHINKNAAGTAYQFTQPNINTVLATTPGTSLPTPPFNFPQFPFNGYNWDISVTTLTGGAGSDRAAGTWKNDHPQITEEQGGDWTAQAGSTVGDDTGSDSGDDAAEDAASASA
jgi:hypothetical protein